MISYVLLSTGIMCITDQMKSVQKAHKPKIFHLPNDYLYNTPKL